MITRTPQEVADWLLLLECGLPNATLGRVTGRFSRAGAVFESPDDELLALGLTRSELARLRAAAHAEPGPAARVLARHPMRLVLLSDAEYPRNLYEVRRPPAYLFVQGDLRPEDALAVGLVGSREATPRGREMARRLAGDLAGVFTIVSGLAVGIDSEAHAAAIEAGGRTIGCAGCGLDEDYPAANRELRRLIANGNGALISPFLPGTPPRRGNFPARNHVLAGLSRAVIVVEAAADSGALTTATACGDEGRLLFAVPGDPLAGGSEGANALLRDGAMLCTGAQDVLRQLEPQLADAAHRLRRTAPPAAVASPPPAPAPVPRPAQRAPAPQPKPPKPTPPAPPAEPAAPAPQPGSPEAAVLEALAAGPRLLDDLIHALVPAAGSHGDISTALLMLELDGRVRRQSGNRYERVC